MTNTTFAAALRYFGLFFATLHHIVGASAIAALLLFFVSSPEPSTNRLIDGGLALIGCAFGWWAMDFFYGLSLLCAD